MGLVLILVSISGIAWFVVQHRRNKLAELFWSATHYQHLEWIADDLCHSEEADFTTMELRCELDNTGDSTTTVYYLRFVEKDGARSWQIREKEIFDKGYKDGKKFSRRLRPREYYEARLAACRPDIRIPGVELKDPCREPCLHSLETCDRWQDLGPDTECRIDSHYESCLLFLKTRPEITWDPPRHS